MRPAKTVGAVPPRRARGEPSVASILATLSPSLRNVGKIDWTIIMKITVAVSSKITSALTTLALVTALTACTTMTDTAAEKNNNADVVRTLAPDGRLRAAINFGNPILANKDVKTGRSEERRVGKEC